MPTDFDYLACKKVGAHILRGLAARHRMSFTAHRADEICHDATVALFERCQRRGEAPWSIWVQMRHCIIDQLWGYRAKRDDAVESLSDDEPMRESLKPDERMYFDEVAESEYGPDVLYALKACTSLKKAYRCLAKKVPRQWLYDNAPKLSHIYEVLQWQKNS